MTAVLIYHIIRHNFPSLLIRPWMGTSYNQHAKGERSCSQGQTETRRVYSLLLRHSATNKPIAVPPVHCYGQASGCHRRRSLWFGRRQTLRRPRITVRVPSFWAERWPGRHMEVFGARRLWPLHRPTGPFQHVQKSQVPNNENLFMTNI